MDPVTQGAVGATAGQLVSTRREKITATILGMLSGMAPDLDVLIRSSTDPLLFLEYHRQFTHALIFIPIGALICASVFYAWFSRRQLSFARTYLFCFVGYATHAVLDACTTYGTLLFWPFSDQRVAWNSVSVVDPLFTVPVLLCVGLAAWTKLRGWAVVSAVYALTYLSVGFVQKERALVVAQDLAASRGHQPINLGVKPSFANIVLWKSVYEHEGKYYVDAIRVLNEKQAIEGVAVEKLDLARHFPWLDPNSQQARDVERFRWFSNQHLGLDPVDPQRIIDIRYSLIPNQVGGMWGITLDRQAGPEQHVGWNTNRPPPDQMGGHLSMLWSMIRGSYSVGG